MEARPPAPRETPAELAARAVDLAQAQPAVARALAAEVLSAEDTSAHTRSLAHEAIGLAAKEMHELDEALAALRESVLTAARAGLRERRAQARMSLAFVLLSRGEPRQALREANLAGRVLDGPDVGRLQMRRGTILQRLGRLDEALQAYQRALPILRRAGDLQWEARLLTNRGVLHGYRSEFPAAERDLIRAAELHDHLGQRISAAQSRHNLGFVAARRGDVPTALAWFDEAEAIYREEGLIDWVGLTDRCELLLGTRLLDEARQLAEDAVAAHSRAGNASDCSEARLALANAALLQGDAATARRVAELAAREFDEQERSRWATLARYVALRARWLASDRSEDLEGAALATSRALDRAGWTLAAIDARLVAARTALERGDAESAERSLRGTVVAREHGPAELRARAWHAEALLRLARGNTRGADAALRAGARALHRHRSTLGSTELRAHVSGYVGELSHLGLQLALDAGSPERVLRWVERARAGTLLLRPVRPPDDEGLVADLAALRATVSAIDRAALLGEDTTRLVRRQSALERAVQRRTRQAPGGDGPPLEQITSSALAAVLGDRALIELFALEDRLHAVVVAGGHTSLHALGSQTDADREIEALRFALRRLARPSMSPHAHAAAEAAATYAADCLDDVLLRPLLPVIGDRPLVLVPSGPLHALPWSLLPSCATRSVTVAPSALLWLRARASAPARPSGRVVLVACDQPRNARPEVDALRTHYPHGEVLDGADATVLAVSTALDGAETAHLACHGRYRADNPLFSNLQLADGPLTVYDLERLRRAPGLLLLSACDSGLSTVHPGDELMGLSSALFALGTATLIASVAPVPDHGARVLMTALHGHLSSGVTPAAALVAARVDVAGDAEAAVAGAAFVCFGAG